MAYVYKYIDKADMATKYVGVVWSPKRTLDERIKEHAKKDNWYKQSTYEIYYLEENINTRTDAEYFESHYISLYGTDKYYNESKTGWGVSSFLPNRENEWIKYEKQLPVIDDYVDYKSDKNMAELFDQMITANNDCDRSAIYENYIKNYCCDAIGRMNHRKRGIIEKIINRKLTIYITKKNNHIDPGTLDIGRELYQFSWNALFINVNIPHIDAAISYDINTDTYSVYKKSGLTYKEMISIVKGKVDRLMQLAYDADRFYNRYLSY